MQHQGASGHKSCLDAVSLAAGKRGAHRKAGIALGFEVAFQRADEGLNLPWRRQFAKYGKFGSVKSQPFPAEPTNMSPSSSCSGQPLPEIR